MVREREKERGNWPIEKEGLVVGLKKVLWALGVGGKRVGGKIDVGF